MRAALAASLPVHGASRGSGGLLTFKSVAGRTDVETLWRAEDGQWDWSFSLPFSADLGARKNQPCFLYGPPDGGTALFAFDQALKPRKLWDSGPASWSLDRSMVATADVHGTGTNEIYVLYG